MRVMKKYRQLLAQVRDGDIWWVHQKASGLKLLQVEGELLDCVRNALGNAQLFLTGDLWTISQADDVLTQTLADMVGAGVYHAPFTHCVFLSPLGNGKLLQALIVTDTGGDKMLMRAAHTSEFLPWGLSPLYCIVNKSPYGVKPALANVRDWKMEDFDDKTKMWFKTLASTMMGTFNRMVILMATRGIEVRKVHTKGTLKGRDRPEYTYRHLVIPGISDDGHGMGRQSGGDRLKMRLHLRRGFERKNQTCGPGGQDRKSAWVRPTLVGYEEEGQVFKTYEVRAEGGAGNDGQEKA